MPDLRTEPAHPPLATRSRRRRPIPRRRMNWWPIGVGVLLVMVAVQVGVLISLDQQMKHQSAELTVLMERAGRDLGELEAILARVPGARP